MRRLSFDDMSFSRNSPAWCPITGRRVNDNTPRILEDRIQETSIVDPELYYSFPSSQGYTAYDQYSYYVSGNTTDYAIQLLDDFEADVPSATRGVLGQSYQGRDIDYFQLGPSDRQHILVSAVVHGNEVDGLPGTFKAMEILMTHSDFQSLRDNYTIFFIPICNPDGYVSNNRYCMKYGPHPSGVDQLVNLNRVWPWFWTEYTPSLTESKGAVVLDLPEAQVIYDWLTTGNGGDPVPIAFHMDQHSTVGDGARYQSRDRCYRQLDPYDWYRAFFDVTCWQHQKARQAKRVREEDAPDLWINYFRSRYRPHFHSWMSTRLKEDNGDVIPVAMVTEFNKVDFVQIDSDKETYQSACNYNMDYVISWAHIIQGCTTYRDAILIEHEQGDNQFTNSHWNQWNTESHGQPEDYRPSYHAYNRANVEHLDETVKHMEYHGSGCGLIPDLAIQIPDTQNVGPGHYHDIQKVINSDYQAIIVANRPAATIDGTPVSSAGVFHLWDVSKNTGDIEELFVDTSLSVDQEKRIAGCTESKVVLLDMGLVSGTNMKVISYESLSSYARSLETTYSAPRVGAAVAFDGTDTTYVIGGEDTSGYTDTVLAVDYSSYGITEIGTNLMPTADANAEAIYCNGGDLDGLVVVIGGTTSVYNFLRVVRVDPSSSSASEDLIDVSSSTLPDSLIRHALYYDGTDTIWIYGGEDPVTNDIHRGFWTITWDGSSWEIEQQQPTAGLESGDPEDYSGESYFQELWSRWRFTSIISEDDGTDMVLLMGGVEENPDTGSKIVQEYRQPYTHNFLDNVIQRPSDSYYAYLRYNYSPAFNGNYLTTSWSWLADSDTTAGYTRTNNAPGDTTNNIFITRRCRTYYIHPPRGWWWRENSALDFTHGRPDQDENEWRAYSRVYREGQNIHHDSPMMQLNTLWPSSWSPKGLIRETEVATWTNVVDPRFMRLRLAWLPPAMFINVTSEFCMLRIDDGADRRLELWVGPGDRKSRDYHNIYWHAAQDPVIELRSYDPSGYTSCEVICYWGGYVKEAAQARLETSLIIEIWQHKDYGAGLIVNNSGSVGYNYIDAPFDRTDWNSSASVSYRGGGWWSEPDVYDIDYKWVEQYTDNNDTGAILLGERDPTYGKVNEDNFYKYVEVWDRADDYNLGSDWDIIKQVNSGWEIYSNTARGENTGWERWDANPYVRDYAVIAEVSVDANDSRVGIFGRLNYRIASDDAAHGYCGSLYVDSGGNPYVQIENFTKTPSSQNRATIASSACTGYTLGTHIILTFELEESTLTLTAEQPSVGTIGSVSVTDTTHDKAGATGILCETPAYSDYVHIYEIYGETRGNVKVRITD